MTEKGVEVITSDGVKSFEGEGGSYVTRVITGKRQLPANMVILSIGIKPNTKLVQEAGIEIGATRAIKVNERMETNIPDVYAIGDCAESIHLVTGKPAWSVRAGILRDLNTFHWINWHHVFMNLTNQKKLLHTAAQACVPLKPIAS